MLGEKLKEYRKKKGWKQEDLARISGYSRSSIINWETGKRAPRTVDIEQLAQVLGISPHDLLDSQSEIHDYDSSITLQSVVQKENPAGFAYWGGVLDEAQKTAKGRNLQEISLIVPILKLAYETLVSVLNGENGKVNDASFSGVSAYNGDFSNYSGNSLTVGAMA